MEPFGEAWLGLAARYPRTSRQPALRERSDVGALAGAGYWQQEINEHLDDHRKVFGHRIDGQPRPKRFPLRYRRRLFGELWGEGDGVHVDDRVAVREGGEHGLR